MADPQTSQENRLALFANVFKGYMGVMPLVTAALAPLLTAMNVIPTFDPQRKPLATISGVLGFLLIAWIFYMRRTFALGSITHGYRWLFNLLPLALVGVSIFCYVMYAYTLDQALTELIQASPGLTRVTALGDWTREHPAPHIVKLQILYLGMFICAEAAFVVMAMREYANDVRKASEYDWMFGAQDGSPARLPGTPSTNPVR